jgi:hypothetical protein
VTLVWFIAPGVGIADSDPLKCPAVMVTRAKRALRPNRGGEIHFAQHCQT